MVVHDGSNNINVFKCPRLYQKNGDSFYDKWRMVGPCYQGYKKSMQGR